MHVEDKLAAGQQAAALLHTQFEQASQEQSRQIASIIAMLGAADAPATPLPEATTPQNVTATGGAAGRQPIEQGDPLLY